MKRESVKQQHITYNMKDVYWRGTHIIEVVFSRWHAMTRSPAEGEHHTTLALLRESRLGTAFSAQVFCTAQVISTEYSSFPPSTCLLSLSFAAICFRRINVLVVRVLLYFCITYLSLMTPTPVICFSCFKSYNEQEACKISSLHLRFKYTGMRGLIDFFL